MREQDSELHMLRYWIEDKGIERALADYYPNLAKSDEEIRQALAAMRNAKRALMCRVQEIVSAAQEDSDA